MSTKKKLAFVIVILAVIGGIWYLEGLKVHPAVSGQGGQAIDVNSLLANTTSTNNAFVATGTNASATDTTNVAPVTQLSNNEKAAIARLAAADKAAGDQPAIEIADPTGFINVASGFKLSSIIGKKVILLDFWTYSCINCMRTIPYLNAWYQKYATPGSRSSASIRRSSILKRISRMCRTPSAEYGIHYPVSSTAIRERGTRTTIFIGRTNI